MERVNLSAIKTLCRGGKRATLYTNPFGGGQWISNGFGAYLVEGVRIEGESALMELWNLSDRARAKAVIFVERCEDKGFTVDSWPGEESLVELGAAAIADKPYIALRSVYGLLWIDAELLKPLRSDYRQYGARWDNGRPLIAVYEDMAEAKALILPVGDAIADALRNVAATLTATPYHWPDEETETARAEAEAKLRDDGGGEDGGT